MASSPSSARNSVVWPYLKPIVDALLVALSFATAYLLRYRLQWFRQVELAFHVPFAVYRSSILGYVGIQIFVYWLEGAYRVERGQPFFDELLIVFRATLVGIAVMIVIVFLATPSYYSRLIVGYAGVMTLVLVSLGRVIERAAVSWQYRHGIGILRVLVVGAGEVGRSIMRAVVARPEMGYRIVGFIDDDPERSQTGIGRFPALGTTEDLAQVVCAHGVDEVIIALPWASHAKIVDITRQCDEQQVSVRVVPDLFQMALSRVVVQNLDSIPMLSISEPSLSEWQVALKRASDLIGAGLLLVITAPFLVLIGVAIKLDSAGPALFRQTRVGRGGKSFTCLKFRSMHIDAEDRLGDLREHNEATGPLFKMRDDPRRTRVGRFLRRTSFDELPQLWNVVCGEMSLIGPRPGTPDEVAGYEPWHVRRLEARPGISGLWQVSGRSNLTFDEMVLLDIYYIENWSSILDLRILLKTIPTVLFGSGAY